jgi:hypothetical protein
MYNWAWQTVLVGLLFLKFWEFYNFTTNFTTLQCCTRIHYDSSRCCNVQSVIYLMYILRISSLVINKSRASVPYLEITMYSGINYSATLEVKFRICWNINYPVKTRKQKEREIDLEKRNNNSTINRFFRNYSEFMRSYIFSCLLRYVLRNFIMKMHVRM